MYLQIFVTVASPVLDNYMIAPVAVNFTATGAII